MAAETARRVPGSGTFLECAAGTGKISLAAAPFAARVLCTDRSLPMLKRVRRKAYRHGLSNVSFAQRDLPEADGSFDAVCTGNVRRLLDAPENAAAELWRVTAPNGVLRLPTFLQGESDPLMRTLAAAYRAAGFRPKRKFTAESCRAFFHSLGLFPEETAVISGRMPVGLAVLRKPA